MTRLELADQSLIVHAEQAEIIIRALAKVIAPSYPKDALTALQVAREIRAVLREQYNAKEEEDNAKELEDLRHHHWLEEEEAAHDAARRAAESETP